MRKHLICTPAQARRLAWLAITASLITSATVRPGIAVTLGSTNSDQPAAAEAGIFGAIGKWMDDTVAGVTAGIGNARDTLGDIGRGSSSMEQTAAAPPSAPPMVLQAPPSATPPAPPPAQSPPPAAAQSPAPPPAPAAPNVFTALPSLAAPTLPTVPLASVVSGRQRCRAAPNGAPDCEGAVAALCRTKGYVNGRSLDIQSAERCPIEVWASGRQPSARECTTETYVTTAVCQ